MRRSILAIALALMIFFGGAFAPRRAEAMDPDVKAVMMTSLYGLGGGTILGLATYPFTMKPRHIAIGASVGLYLGIAVGLYYVWDKYDPQNPLGPNYRPERQYVPEDDDQSMNLEKRATPFDLQSKPLFEAKFTLLTF